MHFIREEESLIYFMNFPLDQRFHHMHAVRFCIHDWNENVWTDATHSNSPPPPLQREKGMPFLAVFMFCVFFTLLLLFIATKMSNLQNETKAFFFCFFYLLEIKINAIRNSYKRNAILTTSNQWKFHLAYNQIKDTNIVNFYYYNHFELLTLIALTFPLNEPHTITCGLSQIKYNRMKEEK